MKKFLIFLLLLMACPAPVLAAGFKLNIQSVYYPSDFRPNETIEFTVLVHNNETVSRFAEVDVTLTNINTGQEITLVPVLTGTIPAGGTGRLLRTGGSTAIYTLSGNGTPSGVGTGIYTVSFPLFDGNGVKVDQAIGPTPIRVGYEDESVKVFPEIISLGTLPVGRYMYPLPIEVKWSFFKMNQQRFDQPFVIRVYTDNAARFQGVPGSLDRPSPGGLVSMDGKYVIPIKIWCVNFGPDIQETGWSGKLAGPPPVEEDDFWIGPKPLEGFRTQENWAGFWVRIPDLVDMTASPSTWRRLIGRDRTDTRFVSDSNPLGDFTLKNPFSFYVATETGPTTVEGQYTATLVVELWSP